MTSLQVNLSSRRSNLQACAKNAYWKEQKTRGQRAGAEQMFVYALMEWRPCTLL